MTSRAFLQSFLIADIPAFVTTISLGSSDVYLGQKPRLNRKTDGEIRIGYQGRGNLGSKTGKIRRYLFQLEIWSNKWDKQEDNLFSDQLSEVADELVDRYDGAQGGLTAVMRSALLLSGLKLERSRCTRSTPAVNEKAHSRNIMVDLAVDVWE